MKLYYSLFVLSALIVGCDQESSIMVKNNYSSPIYTYCACTQTGGISYPDTSLSKSNKTRLINPGEQLALAYYRGNLDELFSAIVPHDTLSVFFFNLDTLSTYDWSTIRDEYKIVARYDLSKADIYQRVGNNHSEVIPFPPIDKMKSIHMYPSFKEIIAKYGTSN